MASVRNGGGNNANAGGGNNPISRARQGYQQARGRGVGILGSLAAGARAAVSRGTPG